MTAASHTTAQTKQASPHNKSSSQEQDRFYEEAKSRRKELVEIREASHKRLQKLRKQTRAFAIM